MSSPKIIIETMLVLYACTLCLYFMLVPGILMRYICTHNTDPGILSTNYLPITHSICEHLFIWKCNHDILISFIVVVTHKLINCTYPVTTAYSFTGQMGK